MAVGIQMKPGELLSCQIRIADELPPHLQSPASGSSHPLSVNRPLEGRITAALIVEGVWFLLPCPALPA